MGRQPVSPMYLLVKGNEQDSLAFQYNPSEVTTTLSVKYDDNKVPGRPAVTPQYAHTSPRVVSFTLFLNEYYDHQGELVEGVVENTISWLQSKCWPKMRYKNHVEVSDTREYSEAPDVLMLLGPVQGVFECYLTDLTINRSIYADKWISDRHPHAAIRAKVDITLRERFEPLKSPIHNAGSIYMTEYNKGIAAKTRQKLGKRPVGGKTGPKRSKAVPNANVSKQHPAFAVDDVVQTSASARLGVNPPIIPLRGIATAKFMDPDLAVRGGPSSVAATRVTGTPFDSSTQ